MPTVGKGITAKVLHYSTAHAALFNRPLHSQRRWQSCSQASGRERDKVDFVGPACNAVRIGGRRSIPEEPASEVRRADPPACLRDAAATQPQTPPDSFRRAAGRTARRVQQYTAQRFPEAVFNDTRSEDAFHRRTASSDAFTRCAPRRLGGTSQSATISWRLQQVLQP